MALDTVAWGVDNGRHSPEMMRILAYLAGDGEVGVLAFGDLKITQLGTVGPGVLMAGGAGLVPCRGAGMPSQSYVVRCPDSDSVGTTATGSGATRRDLVVVRVESPATGSWATPADQAVGPYVFLRVIQDVGAAGTLPNPVTNRATAVAYLANLGQSAEPLALIDFPISTTNVNNGMITDIRKVAKPRTQRLLSTGKPTTTVNLTSASFVDFPGVVGPPAVGNWSLAIPAWASQAVVVATIAGGKVNRSSSSANGSATGQLRFRIGGTAAAPTVASNADTYDIDVPFQGVASRIDPSVADTVSIPASLRGTTQVFALQGLKSGGVTNLLVDTGSSVRLDVQFIEAPA